MSTDARGHVEGWRPISPFAATGLLILYTLIYVLPLYSFRSTRPSPTLSRDHPKVIKARIVSVSMSTLVCALLTCWLVASYGLDPLRFTGLWPINLEAALKPLWLTMTLFAGPLLEYLCLENPWQAFFTWQRYHRPDLTMWRNIVIGPITEEILFRSAGVPLLAMARMPLGHIIFVTPIVFGLAHLHHFYEFRITHPKVPLVAAVARSVVQLAYTTLFGAYATFVFLRSGSLLAVFLVHAFCNFMGLPRFWGAVEPYWLPLGAPEARRWSMLYYVVLIMGLALWKRNLWTLTESDYNIIHW